MPLEKSLLPVVQRHRESVAVEGLSLSPGLCSGNVETILGLIDIGHRSIGLETTRLVV